jgi:hypothetical protein
VDVSTHCKTYAIPLPSVLLALLTRTTAVRVLLVVLMISTSLVGSEMWLEESVNARSWVLGFGSDLLGLDSTQEAA